MIHLTNKNFEKEILHSDIPVIIDAWAEWCMPCQLMAPVFEELSKDYQGKLKFTKLNTDEEQDIASSFGIQGIPSLIITEKGEEIERIVGFSPKQELKHKIDSILKRM